MLNLTSAVVLCNSLEVIRDPAKDKPLELEMGWLCESTGWKHSHVPPALVKEADEAALRELQASPAVPAAESSTGVPEEKTMDVEI